MLKICVDRTLVMYVMLKLPIKRYMLYCHCLAELRMCGEQLNMSISRKECGFYIKDYCNAALCLNDVPYLPRK